MKVRAIVGLSVVALGLTGCTLVQKAVTGGAFGGVGGFFVAGPVGAAVGAGAGAVVVPIVGP
jgi:hypothetical protein